MTEGSKVVSDFVLDQRQIMAFLPHRFPFLLVDRVLSIHAPNSNRAAIESGEYKLQLGAKVVALKNVSMNEPHFQGHFPDVPVMPGVLIIETMAQVSSFSLYPYVSEMRKTQPNFRFQTVLIGIDEARFRVPVMPGDCLRVESVVTGCRKTLWTYDCQAFVGDRKVAEAKILANLVTDSQKQVF